MDKYKIVKMIVILAAIAIVAGGLLRIVQRNSMSLTEYAEQNKTLADNSSQPAESAGLSADDTESESFSSSETENLQNPQESATPVISTLTGASLNGSSQKDSRTTYTEGFYYEPISAPLRRYITGISYPSQSGNNASEAGAGTDISEAAAQPEITLDELRYVHIWHYDFDGNPSEGELICNEYIAQDLLEIFYELYRNEYQLEKVLLIDEYDGDDNASMADNNTSCFNYRLVEGTSHLSKHAYGLAVDVNPLYNPYITYEKDGTENILPAAAIDYADRSSNFAYKIDEDDLCYKLFIRHGFTWGGNWNNSKDYQHFQKTLP